MVVRPLRSTDVVSSPLELKFYFGAVGLGQRVGRAAAIEHERRERAGRAGVRAAAGAEAAGEQGDRAAAFIENHAAGDRDELLQAADRPAGAERREGRILGGVFDRGVAGVGEGRRRAARGSRRSSSCRDRRPCRATLALAWRPICMMSPGWRSRTCRNSRSIQPFHQRSIARRLAMERPSPVVSSCSATMIGRAFAANES